MAGPKKVGDHGAAKARKALADMGKAIETLKPERGGRSIEKRLAAAHDAARPASGYSGIKVEGRDKDLVRPSEAMPQSIVGREAGDVSIGPKAAHPVPELPKSQDPARIYYDNAWQHMKLALDGGINRMQPRHLERISDAAAKAGISQDDLQSHAKAYIGLQVARLKQCVANGDGAGLELMQTNIRVVADHFGITLQNEDVAMQDFRNVTEQQALVREGKAERERKVFEAVDDLQSGKLGPADIVRKYREALPNVKRSFDPASEGAQLQKAYDAAFTAARAGGVAELGKLTVAISKHNGSMGELVHLLQEADLLMSYADPPAEARSRLLKAAEAAVTSVSNRDIALVRRHSTGDGCFYYNQYPGSQSSDYASARHLLSGISEAAMNRLCQMEEWLFNLRV